MMIGWFEPVTLVSPRILMKSPPPARPLMGVTCTPAIRPDSMSLTFSADAGGTAESARIVDTAP